MTRKSRPKKSVCQPATSESQALVLASSHNFHSPEEEPLLTPVVLASATQRSVQPSGSFNTDKTEKKNLAIMPSSSPPPPYGFRSEDPPPPRQPGNYMTIIRDSGPIKQSFLIDPSLSIPSELLPAMTPSELESRGGTRNNLNLEAKYGEIDADIEVMKSTKWTRVRVDVRSRSDVVIRLRLPDTISPGDTNRPGPLCTVDICATSGNIYVLIPKKRLVGKLVSTARGDVTFSKPLLKDLSAFNEKGKRSDC